MSQNEIEIVFPTEASLSVDITDKSLYSYDFNSYSLSNLQEIAAFELAGNIRKKYYLIFQN